MFVNTCNLNSQLVYVPNFLRTSSLYISRVTTFMLFARDSNPQAVNHTNNWIYVYRCLYKEAKVLLKKSIVVKELVTWSKNVKFNLHFQYLINKSFREIEGKTRSKHSHRQTLLGIDLQTTFYSVHWIEVF